MIGLARGRCVVDTCQFMFPAFEQLILIVLVRLPSDIERGNGFVAGQLLAHQVFHGGFQREGDWAHETGDQDGQRGNQNRRPISQRCFPVFFHTTIPSTIGLPFDSLLASKRAGRKLHNCRFSVYPFGYRQTLSLRWPNEMPSTWRRSPAWNARPVFQRAGACGYGPWPSQCRAPKQFPCLASLGKGRRESPLRAPSIDPLESP